MPDSNQQEAAEALFAAETEPEARDPYAAPADSPLPRNLREALTWAREHGVLELKLENIGSFVLKPSAPKGPTLEEIQARIAPPQRSELTHGGYDPDILFAAAPSLPISKKRE